MSPLGGTGYVLAYTQVLIKFRCRSIAHMIIKSYTFNPFSTNCYIVTSGAETVIIDPSCHTEKECRSVIDYVESTGTTLSRILLTHAHIDHIFGCSDISSHFGVGIEVHASETILLERSEFQSRMFGVDIKQPPAPVRTIQAGETISFGGVNWLVLHTPGHSPGSVSFYDAKNEVVFSGDVLFAGSIGRTDLWQGSLPVLMESIFQHILPLPDEIRVLSGHGPETTVGKERFDNPFLVGHQETG